MSDAQTYVKARLLHIAKVLANQNGTSWHLPFRLVHSIANERYNRSFVTAQSAHLPIQSSVSILRGQMFCEESDLLSPRPHMRTQALDLGPMSNARHALSMIRALSKLQLRKLTEPNLRFPKIGA